MASRCKECTRSGSLCKRKTTSKKCWQHNEQEKKEEAKSGYLNIEEFKITNKEQLRDTCQKRWQQQDIQLGKGSFGYVFLTCEIDEKNPKKKNCDFVVKIQRVGKEYQNEISILEKLNHLSMAPRMVDHWECLGLGYLVSEKFEGITEDTITTKDIERVQTLLSQLHEMKIVWLDLATRNVLRSPVNGLLYLNDFGVSLDFSKNPKKQQIYTLTNEFLSLEEGIELDWEAFRSWKKDIEIFLA